MKYIFTELVHKKLFLQIITFKEHRISTSSRKTDKYTEKKMSTIYKIKILKSIVFTPFLAVLLIFGAVMVATFGRIQSPFALLWS